MTTSTSTAFTGRATACDWTREALIRLREEGVCRSIAVSNYESNQIQELPDNFKTPPVVNQVEFHPFQFKENLVAESRRRRIVIEAYTPPARGRAAGN